jgi:AmiR/NasT family two-component response regulator
MHALNSRVVIEQAKGMVAERTGAGLDQAFARLRNHARNHNRRLADVAQDIVDGIVAPLSLDRPR